MNCKKCKAESTTEVCVMCGIVMCLVPRCHIEMDVRVHPRRYCSEHSSQIKKCGLKAVMGEVEPVVKTWRVPIPYSDSDRSWHL